MVQNGPKSGPKLGFQPFSFGFIRVFLENGYDDSLHQCLTSGRGKVHKKNLERPKFGVKELKSCLKLGFFCHFFKFGSLVFLEIAYSDSFQPFITSSRGKAQENIFWVLTLSQNGPKPDPKLVFLPFSQV